MTVLNLTPASERGVEYILAAVQCYAEQWKTMTMSSRNRDANHERCKATLTRIRMMLEDDARRIERAALAQSPADEPAMHPKQENAYKSLVAALRSQLTEVQKEAAKNAEAVNTLASERAANAQLTAELEAGRSPVSAEGLERDAARYRWLRNNAAMQFVHPIVVEQRHVVGSGMRYIGPLTSRNLDAAIDAAIAAADKGAAS